MTDDDKALVERLRGDWPEILVEKHWMMDSDAIDMQREEAADRIEAQAEKIEKLREALEYYADRNNQCPNEGPWGVDSTDFGLVALKTLGETK